MKIKENFSSGVAGMTLKFVATLVMALLMLIPLHMIERTAGERELRYEQTQLEFSSQFGSDIILDVALAGDYVSDKGDRMTFYGEPSVVRIDGDLRHQLLKRGRYDVLSHDTKFDIHVEGSIAEVAKTENNTPFNLDKTSVRVIVHNPHNYNRYIDSKVGLDGDSIIFDKSIAISGAGSIVFTTHNDFLATMRGDWGSPDFTVGNLTASSRKVTKKGFTTTWQSSNTPKNNIMWESLNKYYEGSAKRIAGLELVVDVSQYQMTERTIKYGLLVIVLTFVAFLLTEMLFRWSINLIQYFLSGLALVLFYSLLLSLSEYLRFQVAYATAAGLTLGMVFLYTRSIFGKIIPALTITGMLGTLYIYIYVLTQMVQFALLAGSLGLFVILGVIMYVSQRLFSRLAQEKKAASSNISPAPSTSESRTTPSVVDKITEEI